MAKKRDSRPIGAKSTSTGDVTAGGTNVIANEIDTVKIVHEVPVGRIREIPAWKIVSNVASFAIFFLANWVYLQGFVDTNPVAGEEFYFAYRTRLVAAAIAYLPAALFDITHSPWIGPCRQAITTGVEQIGLASSYTLCFVVGLIALWAFTADDQTKRSIVDGITFMFGAAAGAAVQHLIQTKRSALTRREKK